MPFCWKFFMLYLFNFISALFQSTKTNILCNIFLVNDNNNPDMDYYFGKVIVSLYIYFITSI